MLDQITGITEYLSKLFSFQAYDVQPIRDLSLLIDLFFFNKLKIPTFIFQNIIYWTIACFNVFNISKKVFTKFDEKNLLFLTGLFCSYPLFCSSLSWGIARKHILAFMFIMISTNYAIKWITDESSKNKNYLLAFLSYLLSVFSQPITVLWPFWVLYFNLKESKHSFKKNILYYLPLLILTFVIYFINKNYYLTSETFRLHYETKLVGSNLSIADIILAVGHYFYQLAFPYLPSIHYELGHWSVFVGILMGALFYIACSFFKLSKSWILLWISFVFFPLFVVLVNPNILSDNYLLTPSFGIFILLVSILEKKNWSFKKYHFLILLFFSLYSMKESLYWLDPIKFAEERGFNRRPNCSSALHLARKSYAINRSIPLTAKKFLETHECYNRAQLPPAIILSRLYLQSYILYYENDVSVANRLKALERISNISYYPKMILISLYLKNKDEEKAKQSISELVTKYKNMSWPNYYDEIIANDMYPYCLKNKDQECLKIVSHFIKNSENPYY